MLYVQQILGLFYQAVELSAAPPLGPPQMGAQPPQQGGGRVLRGVRPDRIGQPGAVYGGDHPDLFDYRHPILDLLRRHPVGHPPAVGQGEHRLAYVGPESLIDPDPALQRPAAPELGDQLLGVQFLLLFLPALGRHSPPDNPQHRVAAYGFLHGAPRHIPQGVEDIPRDREHVTKRADHPAAQLAQEPGRADPLGPADGGGPDELSVEQAPYRVLRIGNGLQRVRRFLASGRHPEQSAVVGGAGEADGGDLRYPHERTAQMHLGVAVADDSALHRVHRRLGHARPHSQRGGRLGGDMRSVGAGVGAGNRDAHLALRLAVLGNQHQVGVRCTGEKAFGRGPTACRARVAGRPYPHLRHPQAAGRQVAYLVDRRPGPLRQLCGLVRAGPGQRRYADDLQLLPAEYLEHRGRLFAPASAPVDGAMVVGVGNERLDKAAAGPFGQQVDRGLRPGLLLGEQDDAPGAHRVGPTVSSLSRQRTISLSALEIISATPSQAFFGVQSLLRSASAWRR